MKLMILLLLVSTNTLANPRIQTDKAIQNEGKRIYLSTCIRCHNRDPSKKGPIGPDLLSTPLDVLRTKVPEGKYPSGYTPKRRTKIMPKFPHLKDKVDFIYEYIQSFKHDKN